MEMNDEMNNFQFEPVQDLGLPKNLPIPPKGQFSVVVRFIIPGLNINKATACNIIKVLNNLDTDIYHVEVMRTTDEKKIIPAIIVTICFTRQEGTDESAEEAQAESSMHLLIEKLLGILSFCFGTRLRGIYRQYSILKADRTVIKNLKPARRAGSKRKLRPLLSVFYEKGPLDDRIYSALYWLRRGLAECDPIESFSSFMVSIQIIAQYLGNQEPETVECKQCGAVVSTKYPSVGSQVKYLLVDLMKVDEGLATRLWRNRNAVVAHGGKPVTAAVIYELTMQKFDAADFAFKAICTAIGLNRKEWPTPDQAFFITDAFMNVD